MTREDLLESLRGNGSQWALLMREAADEIEKLEDALRLILPMAKGYAHEHPVGDNAGKVRSAEDLIRAPETADETL